MARSPLLTVLEVARLLNVGRTSVFKLIKLGRLRTVKLGRSTRIRPEDVQAFIESGVS
ncbi:MAG: helix-turn-helix domain-containing protein [Phycisphaeraceae bacterium]|nr:helix-turn-helix domain-containing protein [Phycisphaeraceae bacterium]